MDPRRSGRLTEAIRTELEEIICYEMNDPRIDAQGVSEVIVSPDGHRAIIRVTLTTDAEKQHATIEALEHARQYLRSELGRRLDIFRVPDLHFESAISATLQPRLSKILKRVKKGRPRE
jgi:ribosome-binding factor A